MKNQKSVIHKHLSSFFFSEELEHLHTITFLLMVVLENKTGQQTPLPFTLQPYFQWYANAIAQLPSWSYATPKAQTEERRCLWEMNCRQFASSQHGFSSPLQTKLYTKARVSAGLWDWGMSRSKRTIPVSYVVAPSDRQ